MKKCVLSLVLALVLCLGMLPMPLAAGIDVTDMPGHEVLAALPDTIQRPIRPTASELASQFTNGDGDEESVFQEIIELTDSLIDGKATDKEKLKAIYDWMTENVEYDYTAYSYSLMDESERTEEQTQRHHEAAQPHYVYTRRLAICSGYARLCRLMGTIAGIPVAYIDGLANKENLGPHAWNAALVDGKWLFFDATWSKWDMAPNYHTSSDSFQYYDGLYQLSVYPSLDGTNEIELIFRRDLRSQCPDTLTIPNGVTRIGDGAFLTCSRLKNMIIPEGVTAIGDSATPITLRSITIPSSLTSIGNNIFALGSWRKIKDVYYAGTEAQWNAISIAERFYLSFNGDIIHYNSAGPAESTTPVEPEQAPATYTANPTNDALKVDGVAKVPTAYKIGDANYFQLRDVAMMLNGTPAQFSVDYDADRQAVVIVTGEPYKPLGTELAGAAKNSVEAILGNNDIYINGEKADFAVYKINGANFFQIRALGQALGFNVGWTAQQGMFIESDKPYDLAN